MSRPRALDLSGAQQAVVSHRGTDLQVIACAGSGKTESISRRVAALIAEGAEPASIVAFTFTERAAKELKERITRRVAERMGADFRDRLGPMFVGTIHAYCFRMLQDHVPQYGNYDVLDEHRHAGLLFREHRRLGLGKLKAKHWAPIRDFMRTVDVIGNEVIPLAALDGTPIGECYQAYREALDRYHFLTFGLIITAALEALERPEVFARVQGPLRYLVVDEYQDINPAQERLIERLSLAPVQLTVVGDDDQSIYQWRGSDVRNILMFRKRRPTAASVELDTNRRSRPAIVSAANAFAQSIPERLPKQMHAARAAASVQMIAWSAETDNDEAERIADTILRLKAAGFRYRDIGVLYRSVRTSAPPLIEALRARDVPYTAAGRTGLFLQPEVALVAEIYAWFVEGDWHDEPFGEFRLADLDRIIAGLDRLYGDGSAIPELREYLQDWRAFVLRGHRPVNLVATTTACCTCSAFTALTCPRPLDRHAWARWPAFPTCWATSSTSIVAAVRRSETARARSSRRAIAARITSARCTTTCCTTPETRTKSSRASPRGPRRRGHPHRAPGMAHRFSALAGAGTLPLRPGGPAAGLAALRVGLPHRDASALRGRRRRGAPPLLRGPHAGPRHALPHTLRAQNEPLPAFGVPDRAAGDDARGT